MSDSTIVGFREFIDLDEVRRQPFLVRAIDAYHDARKELKDLPHLFKGTMPDDLDDEDEKLARISSTQVPKLPTPSYDESDPARLKHIADNPSLYYPWEHERAVLTLAGMHQHKPTTSITQHISRNENPGTPYKRPLRQRLFSIADPKRAEDAGYELRRDVSSNELDDIIRNPHRYHRWEVQKALQHHNLDDTSLDHAIDKWDVVSHGGHGTYGTLIDTLAKDSRPRLNDGQYKRLLQKLRPFSSHGFRVDPLTDTSYAADTAKMAHYVLGGMGDTLTKRMPKSFTLHTVNHLMDLLDEHPQGSKGSDKIQATIQKHSDNFRKGMSWSSMGMPNALDSEIKNHRNYSKVDSYTLRGGINEREANADHYNSYRVYSTAPTSSKTWVITNPTYNDIIKH